MKTTDDVLKQLEGADAYIITLGCEEHMQRRNKLKGIAMQKLILRTIKSREDVSIKEILRLVYNQGPDFFIVESPFKIGDKIYSQQYEYIHKSEFPEMSALFLKEKIIDKKWKVCSVCNQYILANAQKTKKCRKCKQGFFNFKKVIYDNWKLIVENKREAVLDYLSNEGIVKRVGNLKKRADFFYFADNIFYIYESKNKELTGLMFNDLFAALAYPVILNHCGHKVEELKIIFNGSFSGEMQDALKKGVGEKFRFKIAFYPIKDYLTEKNLSVQSILVSKKTIGKGYDYSFIEGKSDKIRIIINESSE